MPDFVKRIQKHRSEDLLPGETLEAATMGQPIGTSTHQLGGALGGLIGMFVARKVAELQKRPSTGSEPTGLAATFANHRPLVLAVTDRRLLVFGCGPLGGNPRQLEAEFELPQVGEVDIVRRRLSFTLMIRFVDDSVREFECVKAARPEPFVSAFERVIGRRAA